MFYSTFVLLTILFCFRFILFNERHKTAFVLHSKIKAEVNSTIIKSNRIHNDKFDILKHVFVEVRDINNTFVLSSQSFYAKSHEINSLLSFFSEFLYSFLLPVTVRSAFHERASRVLCL